MLTDAASVLTALGDGTRRQVFELLAEGPRSVTDLADLLPVSRPAVSQHLRVLQDAGLVQHEADGTRRLYRHDPRGLQALRGYVDQFWSDALASFATHVEKNR